jgi:hypothetical protein
LLGRPRSADFTALSLEQLPEVDLKERANGRGTIRFGQRAPAWGYQGMSPAFDPNPQFLAIDEARRVFDLIQRTARKDKQ